MTREEFTAGWIFLTSQPWGSLYDGRLEPDKARLQFELYYERLGYAHPHAWLTTAKLFAGGSAWPSLDTVQQSLGTRNKAYFIALPAAGPPGDIDPDTQRQAEATLSRIIGKPFTFPKG